MDAEKMRVLCVDDEVANYELLKAILAPQGFDVETATGGAEALERIAVKSFDLVLLDVMMPEPDGIEVCRRIKENIGTCNIPVVMITALRSRKDMVQCLQAGADEFLSKPVDSHELVLRCRNLAKMKRYGDEVRRKNEEMKAVQKMREELSEMIVHDLKNPLANVLSNIDLVITDSGSLSERVLRSLRQAEQGATALLTMITNLLDISKMEEGLLRLERRAVSMERLVRSVEAAFSSQAARYGKKLLVDVPMDVVVEADQDLLDRVIQNLVANALKHVKQGEGEVALSVRTADGKALVAVSDNGEGIPAEYREKIFEKYARVEGRKLGLSTDRGLGLTFCKLAVEAHGGFILVDSAVGKGSTFTLAIPQGRITAING
ncbi:MAG: hybrid sensor histidine kinase/response regulator [Nitrospirota bacterium]